MNIMFLSHGDSKIQVENRLHWQHIFNSTWELNHGTRDKINWPYGVPAMRSSLIE